MKCRSGEGREDLNLRPPGPDHMLGPPAETQFERIVEQPQKSASGKSDCGRGEASNDLAGQNGSGLSAEKLKPEFRAI